MSKLKADFDRAVQAVPKHEQIWVLNENYLYFNFYHVMVDILPHVMALGVLKDLKSGKAHALLPGKPTPTARIAADYLKHLGVDASKHVTFVDVDNEKDVLCAKGELRVPAGAWHLPFAPEASVQKLRHHLLTAQHPKKNVGFQQLISESGSDRPLLVYVSRRDARSRRIANESAVVEALKSMATHNQLRFVNFVPTEHGIASTSRIFSHARVIIGPHGAGLTNIVYARPGTALIEIVPTIPEMVNAHYWHLANALQLEYWLNGVEVPAGQLSERHESIFRFYTVEEFAVDIPILVEVVHRALEQMDGPPFWG
jgi:capsular polysaccharide biosynthesis protein